MDALEKLIPLAYVICTIVGLYYILLLVRHITGIKRYQDDKARFFADCYRLQNKYAKKGCYEYAEAMVKVIMAFSMPEEREEPGSQYGKDLMALLEKRKEEARLEEEELYNA